MKKNGAQTPALEPCGGRFAQNYSSFAYGKMAGSGVKKQELCQTFDRESR